MLNTKARGPTAAATMWHHLAWWSTHLGVELNLKSALLRDFKLPTEGHIVKPATILELQIIPALEDWQ